MAHTTIYGIYVDDKLVYIGQTENFSKRRHEHLNYIEDPSDVKEGTNLYRMYQYLNNTPRHLISIRELISGEQPFWNDGKPISGDMAEYILIRAFLPIFNYKGTRSDFFHKEDSHHKLSVADGQCICDF